MRLLAADTTRQIISQIPFESASPKDEAVSITGSATCCETWQFTA